MIGTARRTLRRLALSSISNHRYIQQQLKPSGVFQGFIKPLSTKLENHPSYSSPAEETNPILEALRMRKLKGSSTVKINPEIKTQPIDPKRSEDDCLKEVDAPRTREVSGFGEMGLSEELMTALKEMDILFPTEIQCVGIPAVLEGKSVILGSDTGPDTTLAYMLPIIQHLREDEVLLGCTTPKHPRAVVLCSSCELTKQVFHVANSVCYNAKFRSDMIGGGDGESPPQNDRLRSPIDLIVETPQTISRLIDDRKMVCDNVKYMVIDEVDTMVDLGFEKDIVKTLNLLKDRELKSDNSRIQVILVISDIAKMICKELSPVVKQFEHDNGGTMAGLLLEIEQSERFDLIESSDALRRKLNEAIMSMT